MLNHDYPLHPGQTHAEPYYCTIPLEEYEALKKRIEKLEKLTEAFRWRKFSEENPKENDYYLVTNGDFVDFEYGCYNEQDEKWDWDHNGKWEWWMPLPEPPKECV